MVSINLLAVIVAAAVYMVLGMLWYGPLFGKLWMRLVGFDESSVNQQKTGLAWRMLVALLAALIMAYVMANFVLFMVGNTFSGGMLAGFWLWLGFIATTHLGIILWERRSAKLYFLNAAYYLISLMLMGGILAVWP